MDKELYIGEVAVLKDDIRDHRGIIVYPKGYVIEILDKVMLSDKNIVYKIGAIGTNKSDLILHIFAGQLRLLEKYDKKMVKLLYGEEK